MFGTLKTLIQGANVPIQHVGISGFRLPMLVATRDAKPLPLECTITGSVSLAADRKGINMSRIMRTFYEFKDRVLSHELLEEILVRYKKDLDCSRARIMVELRYPIMQKSLRSGLEGWQYYRAVLEGTIDDLDRLRRYFHFDFVYSSACPCSAELAEHAREERSAYGIPHSQRSKARVIAEISPGRSLFIEDMKDLCLKGLQTETQVMVKREDEQAFAELNGAHIKFVEDAARLLYKEFDRDKRIVDFRIACSHLESLHSHDAVSVIVKGVPGGLSADFDAFRALMAFQAERAEKFYDQAFAQLPAVDRKAQRPGLVMAAIYRTLLREIAADGFQVLDRRTSLTPLRKVWLAGMTWFRA